MTFNELWRGHRIGRGETQAPAALISVAATAVTAALPAQFAVIGAILDASGAAPAGEAEGLRYGGLGRSGVAALDFSDADAFLRALHGLHRVGLLRPLRSLAMRLMAPSLRRALDAAPEGCTAAVPVRGICLAPLARDGDILLTDNERIEPGDICLFEVEGDAFSRGKAYLGTTRRSEVTRHLYGGHEGPFAVFAQWGPPKVLIVPTWDFSSFKRVAAVYRDGKATPIDRDAVREYLPDTSALPINAGALEPVG